MLCGRKQVTVCNILQHRPCPTLAQVSGKKFLNSQHENKNHTPVPLSLHTTD